MQGALTVNKGPHLKLGHEMLVHTLLAFCVRSSQCAPTVWHISAGSDCSDVEALASWLGGQPVQDDQTDNARVFAKSKWELAMFSR